LGIAAVNFGPGDNAQAHQKNEFTSITKLLAGRDIVHRWLSSVSARPPVGFHPAG
jgi:succinyl-diaminopimelate desuccinylase